MSNSVRGGLGTPSVLMAVVVGAAANRAGFRWMATAARAVTAEHARFERPLRIASDLAAHMRAGGTTTTAFEHLSAHDPACARIRVQLMNGAPLADALSPLRDIGPRLVDAIVSAHSDGLPLAPAIDTVIADMTNLRDAAVREMIAELPARVTTPLVLLVLPSFLLLAVAPLALAALRGLSLPRL